MDSILQMIRLAAQQQQAGRLDDAERIYRQVLAQHPSHPDALHLLGAIHLQRGQHREAQELVSKAISIHPNVASFYNTLGLSLAGEERLAEATQAYQNAVRLQPNMQAAIFNLAHALINQGAVADAIEYYRRALQLDPRDTDCHSNLLYAMHFNPRCTAKEIADEAASWSAAFAEPFRATIAPHLNNRDPSRTLRIGFVSPDLWGHAVGRFLAPLLEHLDRNAFETYCYSTSAQKDATTDRLKRAAGNWRDIYNQSDDQAAGIIRADRIDLLFDLSAHSSNHRLPIFARKPAPVQASYLGYPGTTGLTAMDWRISDGYLDPPEAKPMPWIEQVWRLPETYWCYEAPPEAPAVNELPALSRDDRAITFGSLNKNYKVSEATLAAWIRLLQQTPRSRFVLLAHQGQFQNRILSAMVAGGIDPSRLEFVGVRPLAEHLSGYSRIDIALDTFPYNGGTTTCDALWMGVPVVTIAGEMPVGRAGVSILRNAGFAQLIADDVEQYIRIAAALAADVESLAQLRREMRRRLQLSPLMNAPRFADRFGQACRGMWHDWCRRQVSRV